MRGNSVFFFPQKFSFFFCVWWKILSFLRVAEFWFLERTQTRTQRKDENRTEKMFSCWKICFSPLAQSFLTTSWWLSRFSKLFESIYQRLISSLRALSSSMSAQMNKELPLDVFTTLVRSFCSFYSFALKFILRFVPPKGARSERLSE